jgi:thymidine kinase
MPGSITLYIGPTKAGKTTELLRLYYCHFTKEDNIAIVLHNSVTNESFTKEKMKVIQSNTIENIVMNPFFKKSNVILIDNLHLFADCFILNILANKMEKKFICAALDNDYHRVPYDNIIEIIPKCEYVNKLTALCSQLRDTTPAIFSIKNGDKYLPVSRKYITKNDGFLHVISGSMFSGKTTELIRICKQYQSIDKKILSVNYCNDRRYDAIGNICSHNHEVFQTMLSISDLQEILFHPNLTDFDVIMIDEVQFLKNAFQTIKVLVEEMGKIVITSGLDGDYLQQPFGEVCQLIVFADKFTKLNAVCKLTKEDASFSKRLITSQSKEFIGADDAYVAASRFYLTC